MESFLVSTSVVGLAEVGDKTLGMMLANVPVIYLGHKFSDRLRTRAVHALAAVIFVVLGGLALRTALHPQAQSLF